MAEQLVCAVEQVDDHRGANGIRNLDIGYPQ
jgi:hypothetical protein